MRHVNINSSDDLKSSDELSLKIDKVLSSGVNLIAPQVGDKLCVNNVFQIQWDGIPSADTVKLEYSTNNGTSWTTSMGAAKGS